MIVEISDNGVATVTLNRPKMLNAMSARVYVELKLAFDYLGAPANNEDVRVVILKGNGKAFSSGLDLSDVAESFNSEIEKHGEDVARRGLQVSKYITVCQDAMTSAENCRVPVIAAVHGFCLGAGVDLLSACDIRLATHDIKFAIREVEIGTVADFGTLQRFGRKVGNSSWFRELAYTARFFTSQEAKKHGFINQIYEDKDSLFKGAEELAKNIASKSPVAVVGSKLSMNYSMDHSVEEGLHHVKTMNSSLLQSEDTMVAAMAALSKKTPQFAKL